jgi:hypothetical protein
MLLRAVVMHVVVLLAGSGERFHASR